MNVLMSRISISGLLLLVMLLTAASARADMIRPPIYYQPEQPSINIDRLISNPEFQKWDVVQSNESVYLGYIETAYWFRTHVPAANSDRVLHLGYPLLDNIDVYFVSNNEVVEHVVMGDYYPFHERPVLNKNFVTPLPSNEALDIYIRVKTESSLRFSLEIWDPVALIEEQQFQLSITGIYFGLIFTMMLYNLFTFLVTRDRSFLNYSAYSFFVGLFMAGLDGFGYQYLWPTSVWLQDHIVTTIGSLMLLFTTFVTMDVLQTRKNSTKIHTTLKGLVIIFLSVFALSFFYSYGSLILYVLVIGGLSSVYLLSCGLMLWNRGMIYARIYTLAIGVLLLALAINALGYLDIVEPVFAQRYVIMFASAIEVLLLSWALALRFNESRAEQLALKERLNHELEDVVAQRTGELQRALARLKSANKTLEQRSNEDGLTGLYNRRYMNQEIKREFRRAVRNGRDLALLMIDIDHFKTLNDSYGHLLGDQILIELSQVLRLSLRRAGDAVYRFGGEEFAVILPDTSMEGARDMANKLASNIRSHKFDTDHGEMQITVSIGVAVAASGGYDHPTELLAAADEALYLAKNGGRDQIRAVASS